MKFSTKWALAWHINMATTQRYINLRPAMLKAAVELIYFNLQAI
jgi:hypothetical protein